MSKGDDRHSPGVLLALALPLTMACSPAASQRQAPAKAPEPTAEHEEAYRVERIDRVIPLRFVQMRRASAQPFLPLSVIFENLNNANSAFEAVGVRFWIKSLEAYEMPTFYRARGGAALDATSVPWSTAFHAELAQIFPKLPVEGGPEYAVIETPLFGWLNRVAIDFADPNEITVLIGEATMGAYGFFPWEGRCILSGYTMATQPWNFTHELGHYFGLPHPFPGAYASDFYDRSGSVQARNPATNRTLTRADFWDLVYRVDGDKVQFFSSRAAAAAYPESALLPKDRDGANCTVDANCTVTCTTINDVTYTTDTPGAEGMGLKFAGDDPQRGVFRRGYNVMGYAHPPGCLEAFSASQIVQMRRVLRLDTPILGTNGTRFGLRPQLGKAPPR